MNLHKLLLTNNNCYKANKRLVPKGIMWHSTGANNPNLKRYVQPDDGLLGTTSSGNHWNTAKPDNRQVCVHAFIGKLKDDSVATYQTLPWDIMGWHSGGSANSTHIGFEICEDDLTDKKYFEAVYKEACELTAYLCKMYKLDPLADGVIICHAEGAARGIASNHGDVMHWFPKHGKDMDTVRKDVAALMKGSATATTKAKATKASTSYKVRVDIPDLNIRKGPGLNYTKTGEFTGVGTFTIVEESNKWGKLKSGKGWISLKYTTKL